MFRTLMTLAILIASAPAQAQDQTRLLRYPDIHGDRVVFTYGGDLWLAPADGGTATRLTSHPGLELFAKFSPDGSRIAFTGQFGGDEQVYVIDVDGGEPRQLTFYPAQGPLPDRWGYDHQVYGWTPDGESILFRSLRDGHSLTGSRLYTVARSGGLPRALPMSAAGAGALSPDGKRIVYSPLFRDFRTWKRHEGGWAQDLHVFELDGSASRNVTDHERTDRDPMWFGDRIYFLSDRTDFLNLYEYDPDTGETRQLTQYEGRDARWASDDGERRIVYELDGALHVYDTAGDRDRALSIRVPDDTLRTRPQTVGVAGQIEHFDFSPNGERVALIARGEMFSLPVEHGVTRNLTATAGAHEREAAWSPDGKHLAFISDATGEEELYLRDHLGRDPARQLTKDSSIRYYQPRWAPDGKRIAFGDAHGGIHVVTVGTGRHERVADDDGFPQHDYSWSPDGRWLAYTTEDANGFRSIHVRDTRSRQSRRVTDELFNEYRPVFSPDGQHLYYLTDRMFSPQIGSFEWNYALDREAGIVALTLEADGPHPFPPRNTEGVDEDDGEESDDNEENENGDKSDGNVTVEIDFEGLAERVARAPIEAENLAGLSVTAKHLVYVVTPPFYYGRAADIKPKLVGFSLEDREAFDIAEDVDGYVLNVDGGYALVRHNGKGDIKRYEVRKGEQEPKSVATDHLKTRRVLAAEWESMFDEVWRRFRDHFYVENMHGYDWEALREQYRPLVAHVAHRSDLNYVLGEMVAELNVGHAYITGGDFNLPDRPDSALLGARLEADARSGLYRIAEIYRGHAEEPKYRSPLDEVGVEAEAGDYLMSINGRPLDTGTNPYELLAGAGGGLVELLLADRPGADTRAVLIEPLASENSLIYLKWVAANRERVNRETDGRIGYLHIPDMGANGLYEFIKWFYGQIRKDGLIVDVRGNGGGNVSQMLINRLDRDLIFTGYSRGAANINTYPNQVFTGPMVGLLDGNSGSDGDIFPAAFKQRGLGPLIGKRSWGAVIGITGLGPLLDGGTVNVPQFALLDADGRWTIEGYGVEPDIEVDNPPEALLRGEDPQLERAIAEVQRLMRQKKAALPAPDAPPVKTPASY